ncbi:ABC transporter substrate-binding protein [Aureimonas pseudogalii]|uniref:Iron complex transport system substrate-binding protein n=1 Tax=Aureimonas pseudogalii TaxID=1744844 RepID=A0A7W6H8R6_9HYPH|nr:ABC transporter substrate-binding protein [Aureimonas pseudogalii]MBB4000704.1 iron complex transport system substrate-binding protein [Aureimonas pseudogalii]
MMLVTLTAATAQNRTIPVNDDRGVSVEAPADPQRIAAISYLAVDVGLALGVEPERFAVTYMTKGRDPDFLLGLTKDMAPLGQRAKPNLELLTEFKPDLIVAMKRYSIGNAPAFEAVAPYLAYNIERYDESFREVAELAKAFGQPERGEALNAAFKQHLAETVARVPKDTHPRFQIMWAGDTPFSFHTENTAASIVAALGGDNIVGPMTQGGRFGMEMSLEAMLEKDPEVIFVYDSGPDRPQENNPIWGQLSAVKNGRVHYVGDQWVETNGPIAREIVLREAAHYLYPDTFPAVDVRAEAAKLVPPSLLK